mmetsp:Transcript_57206/g.158313  ORF Transcript_57206/g.158313 Transcript_57206/m.158313 type:complete len:185 (+) Transcript_57206:64-618(+)
MASPRRTSVSASAAAAAAQPAAAQRHTTLFSDVHAQLHNVTQDLAHFRKCALENDQARQAEVDALRRKLEKERNEHREQLNKFRYEFDDIVHGKIETLLDMIEVIHRTEKKDDQKQLDAIKTLRSEMRLIKENCKVVNKSWDNFAARVRHARESAVTATKALDAMAHSVPRREFDQTFLMPQPQ